MLIVFLCPLSAKALELGFNGFLGVEASDNIESANSPDEEDGVTADAVFEVYGEQRSRRLSAAFSGEIDTRRIQSDDDTSTDTLTRFLGAAEYSITPRSWRWYVGDILGGVRIDNANQTIDDSEIARRNVFVTGPSFVHDVAGRSRTRARLLYANQSEDRDVLETLYTFTASHERDTTPGSYFGARVSDVFTDFPDEDEELLDPDYNRSAASVYWNRSRGFLNLYGELGVTRYDADDESLNGLHAELAAIRQLGPMTNFRISLARDLNDQALSTVESLIASGGDAVGVSPEIAGFFEETSLDISYSMQSSYTIWTMGAGVSQQDYRLLGVGNDADSSVNDADQLHTSAFGSLSWQLSRRLRSEYAISYERQTFDNRPDETDSILASARLIYSLSTSFELEGGLVHDTASGSVTRSGTGVAEEIDVTENRVAIGLRWVPPSHASKDLTVELKSLIK